MAGEHVDDKHFEVVGLNNGNLMIQLLPRDPEMEAVIQKSIAACVALGENRHCPFDEFILQCRRKRTVLDGGGIVEFDYATLEMLAAAQLTPEQLKAMRQENDDEADRT